MKTRNNAELWDGSVKWHPDMAELKMNKAPSTAYIEGSGKMTVVHEPESNKNIFRTVAIFGFPKGLTMHTLMNSLCRGRVYYAYIIDLENMPAVMAAVQFLTEREARDYIRYVQRTKVMVDGEHQLKAVLYNIPSHPIPEFIRNSGKIWYTRCLEISGPPSEDRFETIERFLATEQPLEYRQRDQSVQEDETGARISLRFHSIPAAICCKVGLKGHPALEGCMVAFRPDPCNRSPPALMTSTTSS